MTPEARNTAVTYRAFISYSHQDKLWGEWLHKTLEGYRVPSKIVGRETVHGPIPRRLTPIFRDRDELATSHDLGAEIQAALEKSMFLLVICSPASAQSKWVNEEIKTFKRLHGEDRVRAVIVGGDPYSGDPATECFPEALRFQVDDAGEVTSEQAEPIAADLRKGGDGKKYGISKLVAGLTGARLDDLIQREQARRNARMRVVAGGMSAVSLAFAGIAWEAVKQRDYAQSKELEAIKARSEAEAEIEFMLTDLRKSLDGVGRLDILEMPGKRAIKYYDKRDLSDATPDELGRRARAQLLVGEVDNLRGDLDGALASYTAAAKTTEEQLRREPDNPDRIFDHSQSVFWVGYIAWQRGAAETARTYWTQYYDQARRLVEIDPDNDDYQAELMYAHSNLGTLQMDQGEAALAETNFRSALEISMKLYGETPADPASAIEVGQSYSWLAEALYHQAKIEEAREAREAELAVYKSAKTAAGSNATLDNNESIARYSYADILLSEGRINRAVEEAQSATMLADKLFNTDPNNLHLADRAVLARSILGEALLHSGEFMTAEDALKAAISIADQLIAADSSNEQWRGKVTAVPLLTAALVQEKQGNMTSALATFARLEGQLASIVLDNGQATTTARIYCSALAGIARLDDATRQMHVDRIISMLEPGKPSHSPKSLTVLLEAYSLGGLEQNAVEIAKTLHDSNFRHPEFLRLFDDYPFLDPDTE